MPENFTNRYQTALAAGVTSGAATGTVTSVTGVPVVPFRAIISAEGANTDEIVLVTGRAGTTLTWTRAAEAVAGVQAASAHGIGATFTAILTATGLVQLNSLDARAYGVVADGTTDDTTALQAAVTALAAAATDAVLTLPPGVIKVTAAITLGLCNNKTIRGASRDGTKVRQFTANIPVLKPTAENTYGINLWDLTLEYNTQQTSGQTGAVALAFSVTGGTGSGWYYWNVRNVAFRKANVGFKVVGTGQLPLFNNRFEGLWFQDMAVSAMVMVSPSSIGQMPNTFENTVINNGGITPTDKAIIGSSSELVFIGLTITQWTNNVIYVNGASFLFIQDLHLEHGTMTTAYQRLVGIDDLGYVQIEGATITTTITAGGSDNWAFLVGANARLMFHNLYFDTTNTSGSMTLLNSSGAGARVYGTNVIDVNSNMNIPVASGDGGSAANIYQFDNTFPKGRIELGYLGTDKVAIQTGTGSPEGVVTAYIGSLYLRQDGGVSTTLYVKTSGSGNTGWTAK